MALSLSLGSASGREAGGKARQQRGLGMSVPLGPPAGCGHRAGLDDRISAEGPFSAPSRASPCPPLTASTQQGRTLCLFASGFSLLPCLLVQAGHHLCQDAGSGWEALLQSSLGSSPQAQLPTCWAALSPHGREGPSPTPGQVWPCTRRPFSQHQHLLTWGEGLLSEAHQAGAGGCAERLQALPLSPPVSTTTRHKCG